MKISGIYRIQSQIKPERIYIGSAVDIQGRWYGHLCKLRKNKHHSPHLQRHYNKYGEADIQFSILLGCEKEYLIANEQFFIDSYKPYFNGNPTAGSMLGYKHSEEFKRKQAERKKGKPSTNKGKKASPELRQKLSDSHKGIIAGMSGRKHSEESINKMRQSHKDFIPWNKGKKNVYSDITLKEMKDAKLGNIPWNEGKKLPSLSDEHKMKISESGKKAWIKRRLKTA